MSTKKVNVNDLYELWLTKAYDESVITAEEEFFKKTIYDIRRIILDKDHLESQLGWDLYGTVKHVTYKIFPEFALSEYGNPFILVKNNGEEIAVNSDNANKVLPNALMEKINSDDPTLTLADYVRTFAHEIVKNIKDVDKLLEQVNELKIDKIPKVNAEDLYDLWLIFTYHQIVEVGLQGLQDRLRDKSYYNSIEPIRNKDDLRDELADDIAFSLLIAEVSGNEVNGKSFLEFAFETYGDSFIFVDNGEEVIVDINTPEDSDDNPEAILTNTIGKEIIKRRRNSNRTEDDWLEERATAFAYLAMRKIENVDELIKSLNNLANEGPNKGNTTPLITNPIRYKSKIRNKSKDNALNNEIDNGIEMGM